MNKLTIDGLECENTETGADSTVIGALYQMRPYPNPGAVLHRANAGKGIKTALTVMKMIMRIIRLLESSYQNIYLHFFS